MANCFVPARHDLSFTDPSTGDTLGYVLAEEQGVKVYAEMDSKYLADQFFTGTPSVLNMNPEEEIPMTISDWRRGFGQEIFDYDDQKRYFLSVGMDLRFKGMAIAGQTTTAVTTPTITATNEANLDWETWSDANTPGTWTEDQALTRSATAQGGTYSGSININTASAWTIVAHQHITWTTQYQSRVFHLRGYGRCSHDYASTDFGVKFAIYDGKTRTYSGVCGNTAANTWSQSTWATKVMASDATELTIEVYAKTDDAYDILFDTMEFADPTTGTCVAQIDFNSNRYFSLGNNLLKLNTGTGSSLSYVYSFPATITSLAVHGSYLYIALGTSNAYWYMSTAEAFTESTATNNTYKYFKTVHTTAQTLYGSDSDNTIRSTANPLNGGTAWSAQTTVGSSFYAITDLQSQNGALYISKADMPYYLNSAGAVQNDLAPEVESATASTSGHGSFVWKDEFFYPFGTQGLLRVGTSNSFINPAGYVTNDSTFTGRVFAVAGDEEWAFIAVDNSTKVEILAGREETIDGSTTWNWHPIHEMTLTGVESLGVSSVYQKRLWITSTSSSDSIYYMPLPVGYGNITADSNNAYKTNTYFITPALHGGFKSDIKRYVKAVATLGHSYDADIYFECWYKKLGDSGFTDAGDFIGTSTNRIATLYIPADGSSNAPKSTLMWFKLIAKTDDTTKTPVLLNFDVRGILYPTRKKLIACKVKVAKGMLTNDGKEEEDKYALLNTCMENVRTATDVVTMKDIEGTTIYVKSLPLPSNTPFKQLVKKEKGRSPEWAYNLILQKVTLS